MALTLRQVRYFIATAEFGQISQAAIHLNISQSAVTSAIQELEGMLGVALFTRTAQGMNLTDSGRHFLNHAYSIQRSVDDALNSPQPDTRVDGTLKVAASYTVMGYFLPHHLQRLAQWYPELELQLFEDERASIERGLLDGRYDIAVLLTGNLTEPGIAAETLFNSERRLWLPSRHPLGEKADLGLADVAGEPYIMLTVDEAGQSAALLATERPPAAGDPPYQFGGSGAQHGRQRLRRGHPLRSGVPALVAGRQTHRDAIAGRPGAVDERRPGLAPRHRSERRDARVPRILPPVVPRSAAKQQPTLNPAANL